MQATATANFGVLGSKAAAHRPCAASESCHVLQIPLTDFFQEATLCQLCSLQVLHHLARVPALYGHYAVR